MTSLKLSITSRQRIERKYDAAARKRINQAVKKWIAADKKRGIRTIHLAIDDPAAMKRYKVPPVRGAFTALKAKKALDALVARLTPDYIVLFGCDDVVPFFRVPNPSLSASDGDDDTEVLSDNPYACSRPYHRARRASYLVPDRVVGRISDVPGSGDPEWFLDYLQGATTWTSSAPDEYDDALLLCTRAWRGAGEASVKYFGRTKRDLMIAPPTGPRTKRLLQRRGHLLHMIKCHGGDHDSWFYGDGPSGQPTSLTSAVLEGATSPRSVIGAMCCYGAKVFDPTAPEAAQPGEPPIPMVYLRQGAYGYLGATTIAWVGGDEMMCADWIIASFLKGVLGGASLGRATLEARQDMLRWLQQQGVDPDTADEKTLLQFILLGDPSIHPCGAASAPAARRRVAAGIGAASVLADSNTRQQRRAARFVLGAMLRQALPARAAKAAAAIPAEVAAAARAARKGKDGAKWVAAGADRLTTQTHLPELQPRVAAAISGAPARATAGGVVTTKRYQYYWVSTRKGPAVRRIRMVVVQSDDKGHVLRTRMVESS